MTLDEAFAELGIESDAGSDAARRAYLRLLRTRKPETDPEGFMRLREAYERVKQHAAFWDHVRGAAADAESPAEARREEPADEAGPSTVIVTAIAIESDSADREAPPADAAEEPAATAGAEADESAREPDAAADEADEERAPAAGVPASAALDVNAIFELLEAGELLRGAEALHHWLIAAADGDQRIEPPVQACLRVVLELHAADAVPAAKALRGSLARWLEVSGQQARMLRGQGAVHWLLIGELDGLPESFPKSLRKHLAQAALDGDLARAAPGLERYCERRPIAAAAAAKQLDARAPILAAAARPWLVGDRVAHNPAAAPWSKGHWFLFSLACAIVRVLMYAADRPPRRPEPSIGAPIALTAPRPSSVAARPIELDEGAALDAGTSRPAKLPSPRP